MGPYMLNTVRYFPSLQATTARMDPGMFCNICTEFRFTEDGKEKAAGQVPKLTWHGCYFCKSMTICSTCALSYFTGVPKSKLMCPGCRYPNR